MSKISPCLWFETQAEEAAAFYVSLLPDSRIDSVLKSPGDNPSGPTGSVLMVAFTLAGASYLALNGNRSAERTHAVSFSITCEDQAEVDRLWDALCADGGKPVQCGWLTDRWGFSWQIVPRQLVDLIADPDPGKSKRAFDAMLTMVKIDIAAVLAAADGRS